MKFSGYHLFFSLGWSASPIFTYKGSGPISLKGERAVTTRTNSYLNSATFCGQKATSGIGHEPSLTSIWDYFENAALVFAIEGF